MLKKTGLSWMLCALLLVATLPAHAADLATVRLSGTGDKARVVFEFPKLVGFHANKTDDGVEVVFDTPIEMDKPGALPPAITHFTITRADPETLKATLALKPGLGFKAAPQMRKIVVDITPSADKKPEEKKSEPKKIEEKKPAEKPVEKPAEKAPEKKAAAPAPVKTETAKPVPAAEKAAAQALAPPPVPVAPVTSEVADSETRISISTVTPTRLAVFERFHYLWIVADGEVSSAFAPEVTGTQAGFVGKPRVFKFGSGTAWRYLMPPDSFVSIEKKSLSWIVYITSTQRPRPAPVPVSVDIDHASNKARLMALLPGAGSVLNFEDPSSGDTLYVAAASTENARVDDSRKFPDVEILPAYMGLVAKPLRDGVNANRISDYVQVTAPDGITVSPDVVSSVAPAGDENDAAEDSADLLFNFPEWRHGGLKDMHKAEREIMETVAQAKTPDDRQGALVQLARLYFANNFGQETLAVLRILADENEDMSKTPDFIALQGAANAMAGHYQEALDALSNPMIQQHREVNLWIGFAAAATEQWHKANESFPKSNRLLMRYPDNIAIPFTIYMAESALRLGHPDTAEALLGAISPASEDFSPQYKAAIGYLRGETARQKGDIDAAIAQWDPVAKGIDRLYHTKASLALANIMLQQKKLPIKDAIDQVDSLRFAWRGDGLEVQILKNLGDLKVQNNQFLSGLEDMKEAAALAESLHDDPDPIEDAIRSTFTDLFIGGGADKIPPLEAVSVYNEFSALLPPGPDSAAASLRFADNLIRMDLLDKAEKILEDNLKSGAVPEATVSDIGAKLAAIYLIDNKPANAIASLDQTARAVDAKKQEERTLLRARAQSQLKQPDAAIATLLPLNSKDAQKLRVDVLWRAQKWDAAATAIQSILPAPGAKFDDATARLVLNMAVAAKLSGDAKKLEDIKTRYAASVDGTPAAAAFGVVTRPNGLSALSDRDNLLKMSGEVDLFKGFLDNYKQKDAPPPLPKAADKAEDKKAGAL